MQLTIIKNEKNELMNRYEIVAEIEEKKIPSREEVRKNLSAKINSSEEKIVVTKILTEFGKTKFIVNARVYDTIEYLNKNEGKFVIKRNQAKKTEEKKEE